jgi:hypothetical protein
VQSVETNLIEARLHFVELDDFWERERRFLARAVSLSPGGRLQVRFPEPRRPLDEIARAMAALHLTGFVRAVAGVLDCFGASVVGVLALKTPLLRADLGSARKALAQIAAVDAGARIQTQFRADLEGLIARTGAQGWLQWALDMRNMLVHRGRRFQPSELRPLPTGVVGPDGRQILRTEVIPQLPRDPGRSDVEMFLDATHPPVLTEGAGATIRGVLDSTLEVVRGGAALLLDIWRTRRASPTLLLQPREQWLNGVSSESTGFEGYAPGSVPYNPTSITVDPIMIQRLKCASLGDAARPAWAAFD